MAKYKVCYLISYVVKESGVQNFKSFHYATNEYIEYEQQFNALKKWMKTNLDDCKTNEFYIMNLQLLTKDLRIINEMKAASDSLFTDITSNLVSNLETVQENLEHEIKNNENSLYNAIITWS